MPTRVPLLVSTLLLAAVTADFVRRVVAMDRPPPGFITLTESERNALGSSSEYSLVLESYDGTVSTMKMVVSTTSSSIARVASVTLEEVSLGGRLPDEALPHRVAAEAGVATIRLHFRGVDWTLQSPRGDEKAPVYEAAFAARQSVLFAGCEPADSKTGSSAFPLRLSSGAGHADLVGRRGR